MQVLISTNNKSLACQELGDPPLPLKGCLEQYPPLVTDKGLQYLEYFLIGGLPPKAPA